jgi:hypothetical protein
MFEVNQECGPNTIKQLIKAKNLPTIAVYWTVASGDTPVGPNLPLSGA